MNNELLRTRRNLERFLMGRTLLTCNAFELEHYEVERLQTEGPGKDAWLLVVHDGTRPAAALPDVYERRGDTLKLVEWWNRR